MHFSLTSFVIFCGGSCCQYFCSVAIRLYLSSCYGFVSDSPFYSNIPFDSLCSCLIIKVRVIDGCYPGANHRPVTCFYMLFIYIMFLIYLDSFRIPIVISQPPCLQIMYTIKACYNNKACFCKMNLFPHRFELHRLILSYLLKGYVCHISWCI